MIIKGWFIYDYALGAFLDTEPFSGKKSAMDYVVSTCAHENDYLILDIQEAHDLRFVSKPQVTKATSL